MKEIDYILGELRQAGKMFGCFGEDKWGDEIPFVLGNVLQDEEELVFFRFFVKMVFLGHFGVQKLQNCFVELGNERNSIIPSVTQGSVE